MQKLMSRWKMVLYVFFAWLLFMPVQTKAAESARNYEIILTVNEKQTVNADPGDLLTVVLTLKRTDKEKSSEIRAMQDEIRYDPAFFEIVEDSIFTIDGIETKDLTLTDGDHAFYINFLSYGEGVEWKNETKLASFQVKVLGESGGAYLQNENSKVSLSDGSGDYEASAKDLLVIVTDDGTIVRHPDAADTDLPATESEKNKGTAFPWWILLVILYAAVIGFAVYLVIRRKKHDL